MSWRDNWPSWQPPPDAEDPDRDGAGTAACPSWVRTRQV
jgi:hypothetical protein